MTDGGSKVSDIEQFARQRFVENGMDWFVKSHIEYVDKLACVLAKKTNANETIVKLAVWLHDINHKPNDVSSQHHIENSRFARALLTERGFDTATVGAVEHCILTHRCKDEHRPRTIEARVIASADAMSHIENFSVLLFAAFVLKKYTVAEAWAWLSKKIDRDWNEKILIPEGKEMVREKCSEVRAMLDAMERA